MYNQAFFYAEETGFEPAASGVTGRYSNRAELHLRTAIGRILYTISNYFSIVFSIFYLQKYLKGQGKSPH